MTQGQKESTVSGAFFRAHQFFLALIPMWLGIGYLFVKDLLRASEKMVSITMVMPHHYQPMDTSIGAHVGVMLLCYFGVGFGLYIIRVITKVEEKNY
jgi:hypothetical protein